MQFVSLADVTRAYIRDYEDKADPYAENDWSASTQPLSHTGGTKLLDPKYKFYTVAFKI